MQIRPIKTKADHRSALKEVERLMDAKPGTPAGDRLEVLTTLVERYESLHEPIEPPNPVDALLYYMESRGLTRRDLEPYLGSRARVAEVLNRRRRLSGDTTSVSSGFFTYSCAMALNRSSRSVISCTRPCASSC